MKLTPLKAKIILILSILLAGFSIWRAVLVEYNYDFEAFFPKKDPETAFFQEFRKKFGSDNDFILIGLHQKTGSVYDPAFLKKVSILTDSLHKIRFVEKVVSPTNIRSMVRDPLMGFGVEMPYLRWQNPEFRADDSIALTQTPEYYGSMFSKDGKSVCLILDHTPYIGDTACGPLSAQVNALVASLGFDEYHVAGRCVGQAFYIDLIQGELVLFLGIAFVLMVTILFLMYRSWVAISAPLSMVLLAVAITLGFMEVTGKSMDVMASAIPTILVVVGLSVTIHSLTKFLKERANGSTVEEATSTTIKNIGLANLFTTLTTMVGFGSLASSGIDPIDDFGLYTAAGVGIAYLLSLTYLPAFFILFGHRFKPGKSVEWTDFFARLIQIILQRRRAIWIVCSLITLFTLIGALQVRENTLLLEDLARDSKISQDFAFFGERFQGTRPLEVAVEITDSSLDLFDPVVLAKMEQMEDTLRFYYQTGFVFSPVAMVKIGNRALSGGMPDAYELPKSSARLRQIVREIRILENGGKLNAYLSSDLRSARMKGLFKDIGSKRAFELRRQIEPALKKIIGNSPIRVTLTGTAELIDKNNRNLALNIGQGLLISFLFIMGIVYYLFRSVKIVFISLLPNILPLLALAGLMGFLGISMKISTAVLFTIAFGIAVDDTIHFLAQLRVERKKGLPMSEAIPNAFVYSGKPIVITSIILCSGFLVLSLSSFMATRLIGLLTAFVMVVALMGDLILLPTLFKLKDGKSNPISET
ncbi:MAG: MMPL family transporter [Bacteroidetes bacterium]|nr:MMPL family transporter [Bacteroidota bacterium]